MRKGIGMNGYVVKPLNMPELELLRKCFCYIEDDFLSRKVLHTMNSILTP